MAVISFAGGWLVYKNRKAEINLSGEKTISEAAMQLLQPYRDEVKTLRAEVQELKQKVAELQRRTNHTMNEIDCVTAGAHLLHHQVMAMGGTPVYVPPERRREEAEDDAGTNE